MDQLGAQSAFFISGHRSLAALIDRAAQPAPGMFSCIGPCLANSDCMPAVKLQLLILKGVCPVYAVQRPH